MADVMLASARHGSDMDSWRCWDNVLDQLSALQDSSRCPSSDPEEALFPSHGPAQHTLSTPSRSQPSQEPLQTLEEYLASSPTSQHLGEPSLNAEEALFPGHGSAQHTLSQPVEGPKRSQPNQEPLQTLEEYLASSTTSEHLDGPSLYPRYDGLAADGSCASSQSDDSFLALMLGSFSSQHPGPGSLPAGAAPRDGPACPLLAGSGKAAGAEQPPGGSQSPCLEASPELSDHPMLDDMYLQADSSDGSADWFSAAQAPAFGADPSALQQAAQPVAVPSKRRGRPRRYDTTLPLGTMDAYMAGSVATVNGMQPGVRKRGAKPKYKFMTAEEAVAHRRERNRSTAIATHEKKKAREAALKAELSMRQGEHDALQRLLEYVQQPKADKEMVRKLLLGEEGAEGSICDAMEFLLTAGD